MFDMFSLLWGIAISGLCLSLMVLAFWTGNRGSGFLVTWAVAVMALVAHAVAFWFYAQEPAPATGTLACALLPLGAIGLYAAARHFCEGAYPARLVLWLAAPFLAIVPPAFALGYDGAALVMQNAATAILFALTAATYLKCRAQAPLSIGALSALYGTVAISFGLCGIVLAVEGNWQIGHAPRNWAEDVNVVVSTVSLSGIGALTLALDQTRRADRNQVDAMTDPMTGLMNRRGLLAGHGGPFGPRKAIVVFDIDHFKHINDRYGHPVGDDVIRRFARVMRENSRRGDDVVRLGGEEFAAVLDDVSPGEARRTAERIALAFAGSPLMADDGTRFNATVSAGIAFGDGDRPALEIVMARADRALYQAKANGRNRIETGELRLVG